MGREYDVGQLRQLRMLLCLGVLLPALACDRRVEPWVEVEDELPPPTRPVRIPGLEQAQPRARAVTPDPRANPAANRGEELRGTVRLANGAKTAGDGVLFVIARAGAGPPLAVKRLPPGPFPVEFRLGPADVMIQGRPFAGPITLSARLDRDGNPLTRTPEDWSAELADPIEPGATGLDLVLEPATER